MRRLCTWLALACLGGCAHQEPVSEYLSWQRELVGVDAKQWQQLRDQAAYVQQTEPSTDNQVRLALVLSTYGRSAADLSEAKQLMEGLLLNPGELSPATRDFLEVRLDEVQRRLTHETNRQSTDERIEELEKERDALRNEAELLGRELEEAQTKLRALTRIEQSIEHPKRGEME